MSWLSFPTMTRPSPVINSPDYQRAADIRRANSDSDIVIIEGTA